MNIWIQRTYICEYKITPLPPEDNTRIPALSSIGLSPGLPAKLSCAAIVIKNYCIIATKSLKIWTICSFSHAFVCYKYEASKALHTLEVTCFISFCCKERPFPNFVMRSKCFYVYASSSEKKQASKYNTTVTSLHKNEFNHALKHLHQPVLS